MGTVNVTISYSDAQYPAGTVGGQVLVKLIQGTSTVANRYVTPPDTHVEFVGIPPGNYTGTIQGYNSVGQALGSPVSFSASVPAAPPPPVMLATPVGATAVGAA